MIEGRGNQQEVKKALCNEDQTMKEGGRKGTEGKEERT